MIVFSAVYSGNFAQSTGKGLQSKTPAHIQDPHACTALHSKVYKYPQFSSCAMC